MPEKARAFAEEEVFTVYVKDLGPWTKALRLVADGPVATASPQSLLVDVDGFYNTTESFTSMLASGVSRIVVVAGGSGMTSLMGFIQVREGFGRGARVPKIDTSLLPVSKQAPWNGTWHMMILMLYFAVTGDHS